MTTVRVLPAADNLSTNQVTVDSTGTVQIVAARKSRIGVIITQLGTTDVFIGNQGVSSTTGDLLVGTKGAWVYIETNAAIFGATAGASQAVSFLELF